MVKKVLLVSFLTLALCLSHPTDQPVATQAKTQAVSSLEKQINITDLHATETATKPDTSSKDVANTPMVPSTEITANSNDSVKPESKQPETPKQTEKPKQPETSKQPEKSIVVKNETSVTTPNATDKLEPTVAPTTMTPAKIITTMVPTSAAAGVTTDKPANDTTVKPTSTTAVPVAAASTARGFDGPSFIGGIILTLGLLAFGFVGFKYYRNQTERNYHTL